MANIFHEIGIVRPVGRLERREMSTTFYVPEIQCPECGLLVAGDTGTDAYKHLIGCFHLPDKGVDGLLSELSQSGTINGSRVGNEYSKRAILVLRHLVVAREKPILDAHFRALESGEAE